MQRMRKTLSSACNALFGDPVRAFGVVSLVLLIALAIAPAKDHFSEWHRYQRQYLNLIRDRGDAVSLHRRFQPGIHQIWLPNLGVVDRCTTCHLGLNEAGLADVASAALPQTPGYSSLAGRIRLRNLPRRARCGHYSFRGSLQRTGRRGADPSCALYRVRLRPMPPGSLPGTPQTQPGQEHVEALRLRPLPRHYAPDGTKSWPQTILRHLLTSLTRRHGSGFIAG